MVIGFLRFLLVLVIAYVAFLFVRIYRGLKRAGKPPRSARPAGELMVKDEICNTYVPREEALTDVRDGVDRYFCSEECLRKFRKG